MKKIIQWLRHIGTSHCTTQIVFANNAVGTHSGRISRRLSSAVAERNLLGTQGAGTSEVSLCSAADFPLGSIADSGDTGEIVSINLAGNGSQTQLLVCASPINAGSKVYTAANGRVQAQPQSAGTYYEVGVALTATTATGQTLEVATHSPRKLIVLPAFSGTASTDIASLAGALENAPDKILVLP